MKLKCEWKDIPEFEGLYKISEDGRVKRNDRILKPYKTRSGYLRCTLSKDNECYKIMAHRLVAICFCDGHKDGLQVNHKDGDKENNHYLNLEWVTPKDNVIHAHKNGLSKDPPYRGKPVAQYTKDGDFVRQYRSSLHAQNETGIWNTLISRVADSENKTAGGFTWKRV